MAESAQRKERQFPTSAGKVGERSFPIEAKLFIVDLEHHKGMMRGVIEEKRRNFSSWVWMGPFGLGFFLEGIERSYLDKKEEQWAWIWKEKGRIYQMTKDGNHSGPFVSLKVTDAGRKNFSIIVPKGGRNGRGW